MFLCQPRRRGFTIVECLVVVTIVSVLIAMLLPALGKARDVAKISICEVNLRTQALASADYSTDNKTTLLASWNGVGSEYNWGTADYLADYIEPGVATPPYNINQGPAWKLSAKGLSIFSCPARQVSATAVPPVICTAADCSAHIYRGSTSSIYVKSDGVHRPNELIEFSDAAQSVTGNLPGFISSSDVICNTISQQGVSLYNPYINYHPFDTPAQSAYWYRWRHMNNDTNVSVFIDGHAGSFRGGQNGGDLTYRNSTNAY